jgi:hypothetical protein
MKNSRFLNSSAHLCSFVLLCLALAIATMASCSETKKCEGSLAEVAAGCPASFDGTLASFPACPPYPVTQSTWRCGDEIVLSSSGYAGMSCYYDLLSHQLVGAYEWSDEPSFCGDAFSKSFGRVPPQSCSGTDGLIERTCPRESPLDGGP